MEKKDDWPRESQSEAARNTLLFFRFARRLGHFSRCLLKVAMSKPNVLVLGGVGFIGRNFVHYLVKNNLAGKIRVIDKVLPATAFLSAEHAASFENPIVEYKQASLTNQGLFCLILLFGCFSTFFSVDSHVFFSCCRKSLYSRRRQVQLCVQFGCRNQVRSNRRSLRTEGL